MKTLLKKKWTGFENNILNLNIVVLKSHSLLKDTTAKRKYRGIIDLEELKDRVCGYYGVKGLAKPETK